ncbi:MAG: hypothetical protein HY019_01450 [Aquabacterium sp.]|uniref:hypothetical protein n=1 Tax=Aquabacterium sp. TaxID=1872578 RepID=UPI0025C591ED|nr:hypothetical protein [Aquabacterium sp.]MBI3380647.1 hypothetical protein [Aquabacterium sp.]
MTESTEARDIAHDTEHRGEGFPQILHDRARVSTEELVKLLLTLSTAGVGVFFIALTGKSDPPLTPRQEVVVLVALVAMSLATLCGMLSWFADGRRNYLWATALQTKKGKKDGPRDQLFVQRDFWLDVAKRAYQLLMVLFGVGIVASLYYLVCRVLHW